MSEAYLTSFLAAHANDERNHFHHVALHEARVATDIHPRPAVASRTSGIVDRIRAVLTGAAPAERCDCLASA